MFWRDDFRGRKNGFIRVVNQSANMVGMAVGDEDGFDIAGRDSDAAEGARQFAHGRPEGFARAGIKHYDAVFSFDDENI